MKIRTTVQKPAGENLKRNTSKILVFFVKMEEKLPFYIITAGKHIVLINNIFSALLTLFFSF
jgi:hypothetical protein